MPEIPTSPRPGRAAGQASPGGVRQSTAAREQPRPRRAHGVRPRQPLSRAGVAERTALTRSTVSRLVDDLVAGGILAELDRRRRSPAAGARARRSSRASRAASPLGLQVNAGLPRRDAARPAGARRRRARRRRRPRRQRPGADAAPACPTSRPGSSTGCRPRARLVGAGLALPGIVSSRQRSPSRAPPTSRWSDLDPGGLVDAAAIGGLPLHVGNEASLAALTRAPRWRRGDRGRSPTSSTSRARSASAAPSCVDGRVMAGRHGWAGEIGHVCVDPDGPPCACGSTGCLEQYAGRRALLAAAGLPAGRGDRRPRRAGAVGGRDGHGCRGASGAGPRRRARGRRQRARHPGRSCSAATSARSPTSCAPTWSGSWRPVPCRPAGWRRRSRPARADPAPGATGAALHELSGVLADPARWLR